MLTNSLKKESLSSPTIEKSTLEKLITMELALKKNSALKAMLKHNKNSYKNRKYIAFRPNEKNQATQILKYIIGIKLTPTNIYYYVTQRNGEVITSNTRNKLIPKTFVFRKTRNVYTIAGSLKQMLKTLKNETKNKITKKAITMIHLQNFKKRNVKQILNSLRHAYNIKTIILNNTNPHNGCRPKKIKTKKSPRFAFKMKKKSPKNQTGKEKRKKKKEKRKKKKWLSGLKR